MDNKPKQLNISFRFQPRDASFDGLLLKYIKQYDTSISNEMVLRALRAFWLTEAHQNLGTHKRPTELKRIAQTMVRILEDQADSIRATFGIERMVAAQTPISLVTNGSTPPEPEPEDEISHIISKVPVIAMDDL
jgi:hypothetical protein